MADILDLKPPSKKNFSEAEFVDSFLENNELFCDEI
jgi:hypothetical protein